MPNLSTAQLKQLTTLLRQYEPAIAAAFQDAMKAWRASIDAAALATALGKNDVPGAIRAMHLDPAALGDFLDELADAYKASGKAMAGLFPQFKNANTGARFTIGFNARDPIAESWLQTTSSTLITNITTAQQDAVRAALSAGLALGDNPTQTAYNIVGYIGANGKRQGGLIGLSVPQAEYLATAKQELASADSSLLRNYLTRQLRDKRFDSYVLAALDGTPIPASIRTKMLIAYSNGLLKLRGDTVALTETLPALHSAQQEAIRQAVVKGGINGRATTKRWWSAHDTRVRPSHAALDALTARKPVPFDKPFVSPITGAQMMYPGDSSMGAPASEIIRCRCLAHFKIDFLRGIK